MSDGTSVAGRNDGPRAPTRDPSEHSLSGGDMQQAIAGLFTTEDVTARLRVKNAPKVDHATSLVTIKAASLRLAEYCDAGQHAYETGNLAEAQALSLALTHAANVISKFSFMLGQAIDAEMDQARTALGAA